eukprot:s3814_g3.t1
MDRLSEQLLTACNKGLASLVPLLLKKGASVNWSRSDGWTPLMSACSGGHLTVAQLLLDAGASVDAAAADGFTALMEACTAGRFELVDLLLEHGASISHATPSGRTAVILASLYGHTEVVELLLNHQADCRPNKFTALHAASGNGQSAVVELLLRKVPVDAEEASGAFISACANGHLEVAQLLLQHGVSPCVSSSDGTTALMKACMGSHRDVAAELILHGASVEDALSTARRSKMPGVMRVLHRAVEEAMSRSGSEARDLDDLVHSIEGKKLEKKALKRDRIFRSHFSVASTSTAFAASEGATESPGRPENEAGATATASPEATEDEAEDIDEADIPIASIGGPIGEKGTCQLSGASWFKALSFDDDATRSQERQRRRHAQSVSTVGTAATEAQVRVDSDDCNDHDDHDDHDQIQDPIPPPGRPWDNILQTTAGYFPETTANRLSQLAYGSTLQMPLYKTACYTIEADTANYDDWNELFCDPIRMSDRLRLEDGTRLFDLPHEHRFAALHRVNWRRALAANMVKTHREARDAEGRRLGYSRQSLRQSKVHSLWGVFASIHRVILLHAVLFLVLLLIAVENELPTMTSAVIGSKRSVRFAILGLAEAFRPAKRLKAALAPNIFAQFTALANQHKAANLGQGFPSFGSPDFLRKAVEDAMDGDVFAETGAPKALGNQYTRPGGEPTFAQTVARIYGPRFNRELDPMKEIVTTIGAQEAIFTCLFSWTDPEDEVVLFTPCFDAVVKSASTLGVKLVGVNMKPPDSGATSSKAWTVNMDELEAAITILMFNTPSAPLGKVFRKEELEAIAAVVKKHPRLLVISDEARTKVAMICTVPTRVNMHEGFSENEEGWWHEYERE